MNHSTIQIRLAFIFCKSLIREAWQSPQKSELLGQHPVSCQLGKILLRIADENPELQDHGLLELITLHNRLHEQLNNLPNTFNPGAISDNLIQANPHESLFIRMEELVVKLEEFIGEKEIELSDHTDLTEYSAEQLKTFLLTIDQHLSAKVQELETHKRISQLKDTGLRSIVEQAPFGIAILSGTDMIVAMANKVYLKIVDRKATEFIGRSLYQSLPEVKERIDPILQQISKTGVPFYGNEFEVMLSRFGKTAKSYFNFVYQPLFEADGSIHRIMVVAVDVTQQVVARHQLLESEQQFRNMVTNSPIAMTIFRGNDWEIEMANQTMLEKVWRRELSTVQGRKLLEVFPELNDQRFPALLRRVETTGEPHRESEAMAFVEGDDGLKKFFLDFEYAPLFGKDQSIEGLMVSVYDVTEKVEARNQIQDAEKKYRNLIDSLPIAVYTTDANGFIDLYNQAAAELWMYTPETGKVRWGASKALYYTDGSKVERENSPVAKTLRNEKQPPTELIIERHDESKRHVIVYPQARYAADGKINGTLNVLIDITDRIQAEKELRLSEERFRVLADAMPQLIWTADASGSVNYYSQTFYDYCGLTYEEIKGGGWVVFIHPDDLAGNIEAWSESINTGKPYYFEHRFRRYDGEYRWQMTRAIPLKDENGSVRLWVGTSTDINDRKLFIDQLELQVHQRTIELKHANEELIRSNNELSQFAYVAGHDLQEPLRKIQTFISYIQRVDEANLSATGKNYFERIHSSAWRMQQLIIDMLTFSQVNNNQRHFESVDLSRVIANVKAQIHESIEDKKAKVVVGQLPVIRAVFFQMEQLFTNLLSNALKFARKDVTPVIEISATAVDAKDVAGSDAVLKQYVKIEVKDNGIGFDPQFKQKIFQVFQRLHTREEFEGTGIGLAICKKIVENHEGFIHAEGKPDEGSIFTIYLPS
ncbi:PAS domain-containing protein [Pollutibacter soli]|uniref:PAS domain-containing protein n=1 Tax=Pollutibacter soli TaxID=3034157 RepID=UPI003013956A